MIHNESRKLSHVDWTDDCPTFYSLSFAQILELYNYLPGNVSYTLFSQYLSPYLYFE